MADPFYRCTLTPGCQNEAFVETGGRFACKDCYDALNRRRMELLTTPSARPIRYQKKEVNHEIDE